MKLKNLFVFVIIYFLSAMSSSATKLPPYVIQTLKNNVPNASVRFDGLVTLPDGTIYLPVLPSNPKKNISGKIISTYPANKNFAQKPDVIIFDSNFAFLRVINEKAGKLTVTDSKNIPFVIKTGIFPQDMLVPPGLILPDDMQTMLGDLKISLYSSSINNIFKTDKEQPVQQNTKIVPIPYMSGKTLLITTLDSKTVSVIPSDSTTPKFTLALDNLPKFIQPVCNDRYILTATAGKTYIQVADVEQEVFAKKIDLTFQPTEILISNDKSKAYVAVGDDQSIFIIDLKTMALSEKIKIKGYPKNITLTDNNKTLVYTDKNTGDIYSLTLDETYLNKFIYNASNISKIIATDKNLYLLSRTDNTLQVIDNELKDIIYKENVGTKPLDMLLSGNKLYILCASNELDIFNLENFALESKIKLSDSGFSKKLLKLPNSNLFLITNVSDKKYLIFDTTKNKVIQTINTTVYINDLQILNKRVK